MTKIQIISLTSEKTSTGKRNLFLGVELVRRGYKIDFITFRWQTGKGSEKKKDYTYKGVRIKNICIGYSAISVLLHGTYGLIRRMNADYYILSKPLPIHTIPFMLAKIFKKGKVILDEDDWHGIGGSGSLPHNGFWRRMAVTFLEEYMVKYAEGVIANSKVSAKRYEMMGTKNVAYIPNVAALEDFVYDSSKRQQIRKKLNIKEDEKVLLHMSSQNNQADTAGLDLVFQAASKINRKDFKFIILGDGSEHNNMKHAAAESGLGERVIFPGRVAYEEVLGYLYASDVAIVNQLSQYPFTLSCRANHPTKMHECMAARLPVLVSDVGELREVIRDGRMRFNPESEVDLIEKLNALLNMPKKELAIIGERNRKLCEEEYNIKNSADKFEAFLRKL